MKKQKIAAVVVTYNRLSLLKKVIHAIYEQTIRPDTIMVVDNASTDGTQEWLKKEATGRRLTYLRLPENTGGAGGFYSGLKQTADRGIEFAWLLDDDAVPDSRCLENLLEAAINTGGLCFFPKVLLPDGKIDIRSIPRKDFYPGKLNIKRKLPPLNGSPSLVSVGTFVGPLLRTKAIQMVGLPIKEFFLWFDDIEYTYRISQHGPIYFVPNAIVYHHTGENRLDGKKVYYMVRNWSYLAHHIGKVPVMITPAFLVAGIIKLKASPLRWDLIYSATRGLIDGVKGEL